MRETPSNFSEFDAHAAGEALGSQPRMTRDVAHGDGEALTVGEAVLEVYRDAGVARVTTPDTRIELFRVPRYEVRGQQVVFEQGDQDHRTRLLVSGDGRVSFRPVLRAAEPPRTRETTPGGHQDSPAGHVASETTTVPSGTAPAALEGKERELVTLKGHVGRIYRTDLDAQPPRAELSLAVKTGNGQDDTDWWKVLATHGLAVDLHTWRWRERPAKLETGWLTEVTGIPEITERTGKDGTPRTDRILHAESVTPIRAPKKRTGLQRPANRH